MTTLTIERRENLSQRCVYVRRQVQEVANKVLAAMLHWLGHGSEYESYYGGVERSNCTGCPDCRCVGGPSFEEAHRDFRAVLNARIGNLI